ncbi:hypothetical protein B0H14DRAFT_3909203 [Mycena olivaceomarginata]|nr:hypothetical protein B0H14DRAFT_3909203 [Mycena olivaceomarginata]
MDNIKNWLDSVDIPMMESPVNLNWGPIMKTINDSPYGFFQGSGWSFLGQGNGVDSENSDGSEFESGFEADSDEMLAVESSDDKSTYGSDGGNYKSGSDFGGGGSDDSEERKAAKSDLKRADGGGKKRDDSDDSDSDRPKKKKSPAKAKTNGKPNGKTKGKR